LPPIPIEKLRKRKRQSEKALRIMLELQKPKQSGSWFMWLFGSVVFLVFAALLIKSLF